MTSYYYRLNDEHRIDEGNVFPDNNDGIHIEIQDNFGNCSQVGVYLYEIGTLSPSEYDNVYYTDTFDEAKVVMKYVLSGLREENPVSETEKILQEINDGKRDQVKDADEINRVENGDVDFIHYGEDGESRVVCRAFLWQKFKQEKDGELEEVEPSYV